MRTFAIVGCGGTGYYLIEPLAKYLAIRHPGCLLYLIDGDDVEEANVERAFTADQVNQKKSDVLQEKFAQPNIDILSVPHFVKPGKLWRQHHENSWYGEGLTLFSAVDNRKTRKFLQDKCSELNDVTYVDGGNGAPYDANVLMYVRRGGKDLTPPVHHIYPIIAHDDGTDFFPGEENCNQRRERTPQVGLVNDHLASMMTWLWLSQIDEPEKNGTLDDRDILNHLEMSTLGCTVQVTPNPGLVRTN